MTARRIPMRPQWPEGLPQRVPLVFVADAPTDNEAAVGAPLTGPSGRIFNAMLRAANIDRSTVMITNVFDMSYGEDPDELKAWLADPDFTAPHLARLADELQTADPTVIVPLGHVALWALTGDLGIAAQRGNITTATRLAEGRKLVPTFHPDQIRKHWKFYSVGIGDLLKAAREVERGPAVVYPKRRLLIEPSFKDAIDFLRRAHKAPLLSVDIETGWGQITSIGFAPQEEVAICIPFVDLRRPNRSYWQDPEQEIDIWWAVKELLESPVPKLGQNFVYDVFWLWQKQGIRVMNYLHDTRLMHHALYAELPKDLAFMASAYSEQGEWKRMAGGYSRDKRDD